MSSGTASLRPVIASLCGPEDQPHHSRSERCFHPPIRASVVSGLCPSRQWGPVCLCLPLSWRVYPSRFSFLLWGLAVYLCPREWSFPCQFPAPQMLAVCSRFLGDSPRPLRAPRGMVPGSLVRCGLGREGKGLRGVHFPRLLPDHSTLGDAKRSLFFHIQVWDTPWVPILL